MTTFAVLTDPDNPKLADFKQALARVFPGDFYEIGNGQYVAAKPESTSVDISLAMGANGEIGKFAVFTLAGHHGWHTKDLWEWLRVRGSP